MYKTLALALAATATALPAPQTSSGNGAARPDPKKEFNLAMKVDGSYVSLNAISNGTQGYTVLEGKRLSLYPGSPAYLNSTAYAENKALNLVLEDGSYGMGTPRVGHDVARVEPAYATLGYQEFEWIVPDGRVQHVTQSPLNQFFACKYDTPEVNYYLAWGNQDSEGNAPGDCQKTELIQNNVPASY